ncbi:MAG: rhomboid family intramembrane serine protease [Campylobacterales bacterium]|nr:rhomboid family intramembrane serine protease [Campylobacterales bacterium]
MNDFKRYPITYTLSALIALAYLYSFLYSGSFIDISPQTLVEMGGIFPPFVVLQDEWYRVIVSMFLHGGLIHIAFNVIALVIVGQVVEVYFRGLDYLVIYFLSGIVGALASIYFHPLDVLIGASGALFGIFGALVGFFIANRRAMMHQFKAMMQNVGVILAINLAIGLFVPNVDMAAHIAGLLFGVMAGYLVSLDYRLYWGYIALSLIGIVAFARYLPNIYVGYL